MFKAVFAAVKKFLFGPTVKIDHIQNQPVAPYKIETPVPDTAAVGLPPKAADLVSEQVVTTVVEEIPVAQGVITEIKEVEAEVVAEIKQVVEKVAKKPRAKKSTKPADSAVAKKAVKKTAAKKSTE
jgi:hypothetical protein